MTGQDAEAAAPAPAPAPAPATTSTTTTSPSAPAATPIPPSNSPDAATDEATAEKAPTEKAPKYPQPKLRLEIRDLNHEGANDFLKAVNAATVLATAVGNVQRMLYGRSTRHADPRTHITPTRSVTVILRSMDGVAYTTGSELDGDHKEIYVSLEYIAGIKRRPAGHDAAGVTAEITGVLTHELVHCYQWDGRGSCPGGLVEGVADWVRLTCGLVPPHWKRQPEEAGRWDRGYEHTAYFLQYLESRFGSGTVRRINEKLRLAHYEAESFWSGLFGHSVEKLWADYAASLSQRD